MDNSKGGMVWVRPPEQIGDKPVVVDLQQREHVDLIRSEIKAQLMTYGYGTDSSDRGRRAMQSDLAFLRWSRLSALAALGVIAYKAFELAIEFVRGLQ